jgi:hypothetical protein
MFLFSGFENVPAEYFPLFLILAFIPILPNLWCIYHAFQREFPTPAEKMAWIGVGIFIPVLGGLIYLIWGRRRGRKAAL